MAAGDSDRDPGEDPGRGSPWSPRPAQDWRQRLTELEAEERAARGAAPARPGAPEIREDWRADDLPDDQEPDAGSPPDADDRGTEVGNPADRPGELGAHRPGAEEARAPAPLPPPPPPPWVPPADRAASAEPEPSPPPPPPPPGGGLLPGLVSRLDVLTDHTEDLQTRFQALSAELEGALAELGERLESLPDRLPAPSDAPVAADPGAQLTPLLDRVGGIESSIEQLAGAVEATPLSRAEVTSALDSLGTSLRRGLDRFVRQVTDQVATLQHGTNRELRDLRDQTDRLARALSAFEEDGPGTLGGSAEPSALDRLAAQLEATSWMLGDATATGEPPAVTLEGLSERLDEVADAVSSGVTQLGDTAEALGAQTEQLREQLESQAAQIRKVQATTGLLAKGAAPAAKAHAQQLDDLAAALSERLDAVDAVLAERLETLDQAITARFEAVDAALGHVADQLSQPPAPPAVDPTPRLEALEERTAAVEALLQELVARPVAPDDAARAAAAAAERAEVLLTDVGEELRSLRRRIRLRFDAEAAEPAPKSSGRSRKSS